MLKKIFLLQSQLLYTCVCPLILLLFAGCKEQDAALKDGGQNKQLLAEVISVCDSLGVLKGIKYLDSALNNVHLSKTEQFQAYTHKHNVYHNELHNRGMALLYADSLLWLLQDKAISRDAALTFKAYMAKANASFADEQYDIAFKFYEKAKEVALKGNSPGQESSYLFRIAMAYFNEEKYLESARMFRQSYDKIANWANADFEKQYRQQEILSNTGIAYDKAGMPDSSLFYFRSALDFIALKEPVYKSGRQVWDEALSVVYGNMGSVYKRTEQPDSAEMYLLRSIALSKKIDRNVKDRLFNLIKLSDLYIDVHRFGEAGEILQEIEALNQTNTGIKSEDDQLEFAYRYTEMSSKYYYQTGSYKAAIARMQQHDSVKERKWKLTYKILENDLQNGIENIGHQKQILSLEKDVQISEQQKIILFLTIVLSIAGILFVYYSLKKYIARYRKLQKKNEQITIESAEKEALLTRKIRQDELNFMALIENTDDFLWSVDKDYSLLAFNKAYREYFYSLFGEYPETGKPEIVKKYLPENYLVVVQGYKAIFSGGYYEIVDKGIPVKGVSPDIEVRFKPIKDELGNITGVSCFRRDITEYMRLIKRLEKNNEQLKEIAWVQSHKLRGPLTTLMGIADFIAESGIEEIQNEEILNNLREKLDEMDKIIHEIVGLAE